MARELNKCAYMRRDGELCGNNCYGEICCSHKGKVNHTPCMGKCGNYTKAIKGYCPTCLLPKNPRGRKAKAALYKPEVYKPFDEKDLETIADPNDKVWISAGSIDEFQALLDMMKKHHLAIPTEPKYQPEPEDKVLAPTGSKTGIYDPPTQGE